MNFEIKNQDEHSLSTEILELQEEAKKHLANSKADNTKRAYRSDWTRFSKWCEKNAFCDLPATPETLAYYITYLGKHSKLLLLNEK
ncbi:hypothetical protein [Sutcliffiella horikoshii]|uniref:hypothetical protein n=1 Tax=Sutcliffiella horikoshii TaxID=79883 RepID=UPI001CFF516E|nr:hypothetical protein [Sutcliffiella horikoshii]